MSIKSRSAIPAVSDRVPHLSSLLRIQTDPHFLGNDTTTVMLSGIENCAGVICACLPTMLPIWNSLHHGRAQSSTKGSKLTLALDRSVRPKVLNMKTPLCNGSSNYDASVKHESGSFQQLREEEADRPDNPDFAFPPPLKIQVTTNIETSQKASPFESRHETLKVRQPGW